MFDMHRTFFPRWINVLAIGTTRETRRIPRLIATISSNKVNPGEMRERRNATLIWENLWNPG